MMSESRKQEKIESFIKNIFINCSELVKAEIRTNNYQGNETEELKLSREFHELSKGLFKDSLTHSAECKIFVDEINTILFKKNYIHFEDDPHNKKVNIDFGQIGLEIMLLFHEYDLIVGYGENSSDDIKELLQKHILNRNEAINYIKSNKYSMNDFRVNDVMQEIINLTNNKESCTQTTIRKSLEDKKEKELDKGDISRVCKRLIELNLIEKEHGKRKNQNIIITEFGRYCWNYIQNEY